MLFIQDVLGELIEGQAPKVDPYILILQDYIATWVEDIREGLLDNHTRLYRSYRQQALSQVVAGMLGEYDDTLLSIAAETLHIQPVELWTQIYITAYRQARGIYEQSPY